MNTKVKNTVTSLVFIIFVLAVSLCCIFRTPAETSQSERRPLAQFPKYQWGEYVTQSNGSTEFKAIKDFDAKEDLNITVLNSSIKNYIAGFDDYSLDQFPLRDTMREIKAFVELKIFNKKDNNDLYQVDGYISEMQPSLNLDSLNNAAGIWNNIYAKYLEGKADKVVLSVIPDKNYFMAAQNGYLALDYGAMVDAIKDACIGFEYADIFEELALDDYYKTDTHWRQEEIVAVAKKLAEALGVEGEYSFEYEKNSLDIPFYGVYAGQLAVGAKGETINYLTNDVISNCKLFDYEMNKYVDIYDEAKANGSDPYDFFLSGAKKGPMRIENPSQSNGKTLVVFRDSFGSSIAPLLVDGYSTVFVVDLRVTTAGMINNVVGGFEGKDVLFLSSAMVLNDSTELKRN